MAIDKDNVKKAIDFLRKINPQATVLKHEEFDCEEKDKLYTSTKYIHCIGQCYDDGFHNVITNIKNMDDRQWTMWNECKDDLDNSSFHNQLPGDITQIGWF